MQFHNTLSVSQHTAVSNHRMKITNKKTVFFIWKGSQNMVQHCNVMIIYIQYVLIFKICFGFISIETVSERSPGKPGPVLNPCPCVMALALMVHTLLSVPPGHPPPVIKHSFNHVENISISEYISILKWPMRFISGPKLLHATLCLSSFHPVS